MVNNGPYTSVCARVSTHTSKLILQLNPNLLVFFSPSIDLYRKWPTRAGPHSLALAQSNPMENSSVCVCVCFFQTNKDTIAYGEELSWTGLKLETKRIFIANIGKTCNIGWDPINTNEKKNIKGFHTRLLLGGRVSEMLEMLLGVEWGKTSQHRLLFNIVIKSSKKLKQNHS